MGSDERRMMASAAVTPDAVVSESIALLDDNN